MGKNSWTYTIFSLLIFLHATLSAYVQKYSRRKPLFCDLKVIEKVCSSTCTRAPSVVCIKFTGKEAVL